jgi:hypothetical protein
LEITEAILSKSNQMLEKVLSNGINLTREELAKEYDKINIKTDENRLSHLFMCAELEGLICSGAIKSGKQSFGLLEERVPNKILLNRDESLAELAKRYFTSHGPATIQDFSWWSGLSQSESKKALELVKINFTSEVIDKLEYWFADSMNISISNLNSVYLLPAYDEFLISYKDRSASLALTHNKKTVSDNGIFRPLIVINGQVAGLWKKSIKKDKLMIETTPFQPVSNNISSMIEAEALRFGKFLKKEVVVDIL